jgi:hypothetical protein
MIVGPNAGQTRSEGHVIERLSAILVEVPVAAQGERPYDVVDICEIRLEVLSLLNKMCRKKHSGELIARHPQVIGRLVRVMNDELNGLYDWKYGHEYRYVD